MALGAGWFFFQKYQKKNKGDTDDSDSGKDKTDFDESDDSDDDSDDEKPIKSRKEKYTAPLSSAKLYPQPSYDASLNMAGAGAHGNGYENAIRHNNALDVYPLDSTHQVTRPPRTSASAQHSRQKPLQRGSLPDHDSDDSSDDSDVETEEERRRRKRREAKKKAKRRT